MAEAQGLRIMVYDSSDVRGWTNAIRAWAPTVADNFLDATDINVGLTSTWMSGGWVYRQFGRFDYVKGFSNWLDALSWLGTVGEDRPIAEIQYWGHGGPGRVWMNGQSLHVHTFDASIYGPTLRRLRTRLRPDSLIWFRTCSTFAADKGKVFATMWAKRMGCNIAGHTFIVHMIQAGLYCIRSGESAWWPADEGIVGPPEAPTKSKWGSVMSPRWILATRSTLPSWAYNDANP
jgi:hypothetical protein